jgi:hypothetical protein
MSAAPARASNFACAIPKRPWGSGASTASSSSSGRSAVRCVSRNSSSAATRRRPLALSAAADGAHAADLPVADAVADLPQDGELLGALPGGGLVVPRRGADAQHAVGDLDAGELPQAADVDDDARSALAVLHHRHEAHAAGEQGGVVAVLGQRVDGLIGRRRPEVAEGRGIHQPRAFPASVIEVRARIVRTP